MVNRMNDEIWTIKNPSPVVVGTGLLALDMIINGNNHPTFKAGGSFGNVITILSYLGWDSYPIARLGNDDVATKIKNDLEYFNVNLNYISSENSTKTPIIIEKLYVDKFKIPKHSFRLSCPKCNSWLPRYKSILLKQVEKLLPKIPDASVFYFDRLAPGVLKLAEEYNKRGALIIFEPSKISDEKLLSKCLKICHILKYQDGAMKRHEKLIETTSIPLEIETHGSKGLRYRFITKKLTYSKWFHLRAYDVGEIKDTVGAGDWCTAGLIQMLGQNGSSSFFKLGQKDYLKALQFGQALAALTCKFVGPRGGMYLLEKNEFEKNIELIINNDNNLNLNYEILEDCNNYHPICIKCEKPL